MKQEEGHTPDSFLALAGSVGHLITARAAASASFESLTKLPLDYQQSVSSGYAPHTPSPADLYDNCPSSYIPCLGYQAELSFPL